jgi:hypothetical protein
LAIGFTAGTSVDAQYPPYNQAYTPQYSPDYPPANTTPTYTPQFRPQPASQSAGQTDEQLLTIGRLLEQQGRYAQAQRIYTELERRRMTTGVQQPPTMQPNAPYPYQSPGGMVPQTAVSPGGWQAAPGQMPPTQMTSAQMTSVQMTNGQMTNGPMGSARPMMQLAPQNCAPSYDQRPEMVATQVSQSAPLPPPAPPSEAYVVDTEVTPPPKTTTPVQAEGWRSAIAPLPAAFRSWSRDVPTPTQQSSTSAAQPNQPSVGEPAGGLLTTESNALPDLPIAPMAPLNSMGRQFPPPTPQTPTNLPPRFVPPSVASAERRAPVGPERELSAPPTMRLTPMPQKKFETLDSDRETSQEQSDAIRIIPGQRPLLPPKLENDGGPENRLDRPTLDRPTSVTATDKPRSGWNPQPPASVIPTEQHTAAKTERVFDLAAWVSTPEFREIHTAPVLEGLELLARPEPRHRAVGAMRIAAAGEDARTALPVLRRLLATEVDKTVRLRIAETVLKAQPNDRAATQCLSELLSDRNDWELRETAASALGAAATGRNSIAVAHLTDALDDSNPRVRAAAAASLARFGRAAGDSVLRLEGAAANDVPIVQRAASMALVSIRGGENESLTDRSSAVGRDDPFGLKPLSSTLSAPLPATVLSGRVKLSDQLSAGESDESDVPETAVANAAPKLFPADRMSDSRSLTPVPEMADDDAIPANATQVDAPPKPSPAPTGANQPVQVDPTQAQLQPTPQPQAATVAPSLPAATTSPFLLQSEAGASKASSKP